MSFSVDHFLPLYPSWTSFYSVGPWKWRSRAETCTVKPFNNNAAEQVALVGGTGGGGVPFSALVAERFCWSGFSSRGAHVLAER